MLSVVVWAVSSANAANFGKIDFGQVPVGTRSATKEAAYCSTGGLLTTSKVSLGEVPCDFSFVYDHCTGATLAPGKCCGIGVAFTPTAIGPFSATLSIET